MEDAALQEESFNLFQNTILLMDPKKFTTKRFKLFIRFLRAINPVSSVLSHQQTNPYYQKQVFEASWYDSPKHNSGEADKDDTEKEIQAFFKYCSCIQIDAQSNEPKIHGIDYLWRLAFECQTSKIARQAVTILLHLYTPKKSQDSTLVNQRVLQKCFDRIALLKGRSEFQLLLQTLSVLQTFILHFDCLYSQNSRVILPLGNFYRGSFIEVKYYFNNGVTRLKYELVPNSEEEEDEQSITEFDHMHNDFAEVKSKIVKHLQTKEFSLRCHVNETVEMISCRMLQVLLDTCQALLDDVRVDEKKVRVSHIDCQYRLELTSIYGPIANSRLLRKNTTSAEGSAAGESATLSTSMSLYSLLEEDAYREQYERMNAVGELDAFDANSDKPMPPLLLKAELIKEKYEHHLPVLVDDEDKQPNQWNDQIHSNSAPPSPNFSDHIMDGSSPDLKPSTDFVSFGTERSAAQYGGNGGRRVDHAVAATGVAGVGADQWVSPLHHDSILQVS
ncbi:hypothetical protein Ciccas_001544 [Cichlidogyrus casuarinus]|uniref:ENTH domain-containing protein n=1 Tax=Cichlidogyrus casuarinus TaxID=1844966 RepID=A0ABD2QJP4_9PLAT